MRGYLQKRLHGVARIQTERRCVECGRNPPMNSQVALCAGCRVKRDMQTFVYRPRPPQGEWTL